MKKKRFFAVLIIISLITLPFSFKASAVSNSAKAAVVINGDTGEVIYAKNQSERLPMASTTKIMTGKSPLPMKWCGLKARQWACFAAIR